MIPPRTFFIQDDNKWANVCYIFGQNNRKQSLWIKVKQSEKNVKIQDRDRTNGNLECAFFHAISQCHAHHTVELGDKELFGHPNALSM